MGVAGLALDTVGQVEGHAGTLTLEGPGHEFLQAVDQVLVALQGHHLVAAPLQGVDDAANGGEAVLLPVSNAEQVDDLLGFTIVDDGDFHWIFLPGRAYVTLSFLCLNALESQRKIFVVTTTESV